MESTVEQISSSVQSWVKDHELAAIGGVLAAAVGASVAYSWRKAPQHSRTEPDSTPAQSQCGIRDGGEIRGGGDGGRFSSAAK
ncbi:hypothetical protein ZEAMMB73_Zm00001d045833 [Zea mays]|uniref:Uncharacterized protein n=1 Tax=Zea mays TaxID=4577 RepID=A0A1D6NZG3_MAIZE|nr:hypothetical protein ZEAMMB73_Zm00001d045833 [Zea mays]